MISIGKAGGFNARERAKLDLVVGQANQIERSQEYRDAILAHETIDGRLKYKGFYDTADTCLEVYKKLLASSEPLEIYLETPPWWKRRWTSELARENGDGSITINRDYFARASVADLVDTVVHEKAHRTGYHHSYKWNTQRDYSVPYAAGRIAGKLAGGIILTPLGEQLKKVAETV